MNNPILDTSIIDFIKRNEGFRQYPYQCTAGKLTIGYGCNLEDRGISEKIAHTMLTEEIYITIRELSGIFSDFYSFSDNRKVALTDMCYNLGLTKFSLFKKMIAAIKCGDWGEAAKEAHDSTWYSQVGDRSKRVVALLKKG